MSARSSAGLFVAALVATACAPDEVAPGYEDPVLTDLGGAPGAGGSSSAPLDGSGGATPSPVPSNPGPTPMGVPSTVATGGPAPAPSTTAPPSTVPETSHPASATCDLSGRWIVTQRSVEEALGAQTAVRHWLYFEFSQEGEQVTATRGLDCGVDVVPVGALSGAADLHKSWPAIMAKNPMTGRKGSIKVAGAGCSVSFPTIVYVYGATSSYYNDPSRPLPGPDQKASGSTPGWEDWDGDGNPGMTYRISGIATGSIYEVARYQDTWSGTIGGTAKTPFTVGYVPRHEADLLGYDGSPLLTTQGTTSANAALHFIEFARLDATQATGDDAATCDAVRKLAVTLTPKANEKQAQ